VFETDVEVLAIIEKSEAEAWLAQFGESEETNDETDPALGSEE
jgi:mRNA interferase RelE/StbE